MRGCQGHYATDVVCVGYLPVCGLYARDFEVHDVSIKHEKMGDTGSRRIHLGFSADDPLVLSLLRRKKDVPRTATREGPGSWGALLCFLGLSGHSRGLGKGEIDRLECLIQFGLQNDEWGRQTNNVFLCFFTQKSLV